MQSKWIRTILSLMIVLGFLTELTGCSAITEAKKEAAYAAFMVQQINTVSDSISDLKAQMSGFSEEKLSDQNWIAETKSCISQINNALDQIIQYANVPEKMASTQETIVELCEKGKDLTTQFENSVAAQDQSAMLKVNQGLEDLSFKTSEYIQQLKEKIGNE